MLYRIVKPLAALTLKVNFRKIYFSKVNQIPQDHPVILAVNHPTAFIEPCVMACFQPNTLHFLVRGDFFRNKFARMYLEALHMIPIYRMKDGGYSKVKDNFVTFERCYEALRKQKTLMILAEGGCVQEKRLRSIKKGTARIAFGAYKKYKIRDIRIVPVGVNYMHPDRFRSDLMMEVGETILLEDYLDLYDQQPQAAIRQLTNDIYQHLEPQVIIIEKKEDEELAEQLFELFRNNQTYKVWPPVSDEPRHLQREKSLANWINACSEDQKKKVKTAANRYFEDLKNNPISDFGLVQPHHYSFNNSMTLAVGFIPFLLGVLGNFLPMLTIKLIGDTFVKSAEFRQSVKLAAGIGVYLLYFATLFVLCWSYKSIFGLIIVLMLPVWGYFALLYSELFIRWRKGRALKKISIEKQNELRLQRSVFLDSVRKQINK